MYLIIGFIIVIALVQVVLTFGLPNTEGTKNSVVNRDRLEFISSEPYYPEFIIGQSPVPKEQRSSVVVPEDPPSLGEWGRTAVSSVTSSVSASVSPSAPPDTTFTAVSMVYPQTMPLATRRLNNNGDSHYSDIRDVETEVE